MPSGNTALDLIQSSMRLAGIIATGETPKANEVNDALAVLNDMIETWSTESLSVWGSASSTFTTVPGQSSYTIGPGGNWASNPRPVRIDDTAYCTVNGVDYPVLEWGQDDYAGVVIKTQQQQIIERFLYVNDNPLANIILYPVPSSVITVTFFTDRVLTQIPTLPTVLIYPPGYYIAMRYTLAILLAAEYGAPVDASVTSIAISSKANIKRANKRKQFAKFDSGLTSDGGGASSWQRGY
jgi:hypothetical protein